MAIPQKERDLISETPEVRKRRLRLFTIKPSMLLAMLRDGTRSYHFAGLPADAEVFRCGYAYENDRFYLTVWSASFDIVPDFEMLPFDFSLTITLLPLPAETAAQQG